jgi:hypothetical protein
MRSVITRMNAETEEYSTINAEYSFPSLPSSPRISNNNSTNQHSPSASTASLGRAIPPRSGAGSKPTSLTSSAADPLVNSHSQLQRHLSVDSGEDQRESPRTNSTAHQQQHSAGSTSGSYHSPPSSSASHLLGASGSNRSTADSDGSDSTRDSISPRSFPTPQYAPSGGGLLSPRPGQASGEGMTGTYKPSMRGDDGDFRCCVLILCFICFISFVEIVCYYCYYSPTFLTISPTNSTIEDFAEH